MWTSLRTAVSGMLAQQRALDVSADNLSKLQVPGSKTQRASFLEMAPELRYFGVPDGEGNVVMEAREAPVGVQASATLHDLSEGPFMATGDPMDIAIDGGGYLEITLPNGQIAYTPGASLRIDGGGRLMTATGAMISPAITVPQGVNMVEVAKDGTITAQTPDGVRETIGQLRLVRFANPEGLEQAGENALLATVASGAPIESLAGEPGVGTIVTGIIEQSNIDTREELVRVIQAQRAYELNVRALKTVDEMLQDATSLRRQ